MERLEFLSGVLLVSQNPARLADFYTDVLNVPLEVEEHEGTLPHWGATLGEIHFAIHPIEDFPDGRSGVGAVKLAFTVFDLAAALKRLEAAGVALVQEPQDTGFFVSAMVEDPDGNLIELTQMVDEWFESLEKRRADGHDVVQAWRRSRSE